MGDPFPTPLVYVNANGFGPTTLPEKYEQLPFVTFTKWENLGKAANFGNFQLGQQSQQRYATNTYVKFDDKRALFAAGVPQTVTSTAVEGDDFELVDTSKHDNRTSRGPRLNFKRGGNNMRGGRGRGGRATALTRDATTREPQLDPNQPQLKGKQAKFLLQGTRRGKQWSKRTGQTMGRRRDFNDREMMKEASVKIKSNWELVEQIDIPQLSKMMTTVPQPENILTCGELRKYDDSFDRLNLRSTKPLKLATETSFVYAGTLEDPVIEKLVGEKKGTVYTTDEILSYLMTAPRSVKSWDLIFTRVGDVLFIDKRDDAQLESLTVNETFTDRISEKDEARLKMPYNSPDKLGLEATAINQSFLLQVLKKDDGNSQPNPNPFMEEGEQPRQPITYQYRSWQLGSHKLVARTEIHAAAPVKSAPNQPDKKVNVYALNEFDSKLTGNVDWRQKLDNQKGAVMANELKNNSAKVARWIAQSLLAGVDAMKLGFVSRVSPTDPSKHVVLGVNSVRPRDLAMQITLNERNMWGIVKSIIDLVMSKEPGKYLLVRDPNKAVVKLYEVPMSTFEESDDEGEDEEEIEEEEEGDVFRQPEDEEEEDEEDM